MSIGLIGRKLGLTQIFGEGGEVIPVTIIEAGPCTVTQQKVVARDGYDAVQLGFGKRKESRLRKPLKGHLERAGAEGKHILREFRTPEVEKYAPGAEVRVDIFEGVDWVDVTGISKGKGFAGVMKRWGFKGGPASHGAEKWHRRGGSIGASAYPSRVFKGRKMPGRMGGKRSTSQSLKVVKIDKERNVLLIRGAIPGPRGGYVLVKEAVKRRTVRKQDKPEEGERAEKKAGK